MLRRFEAVAAGGYPYLVAEEAGRLLGYAYAGAYRPRPAYRSTVENSIYIAPDSQGRGVGGALLDALMQECTRRGFRQMIAVIGDGTGASLGSRRLHERAGFRLIGVAEKVGFKHGRWLDQMLMQKDLGEAIAPRPRSERRPQPTTLSFLSRTRSTRDSSAPRFSTSPVAATTE